MIGMRGDAQGRSLIDTTFARPGSPGDGMSPAALGRFHREALWMAFKRHSSGDAADTEAADTIDEWLASGQDLPAGLPLGELHAGLAGRDPALQRVALANLLLEIAAAGGCGEWHLDLLSGGCLGFDRWIVPGVRSAEVRAREDSLTLDVQTADRAQRHEWHRADGVWSGCSEGAATRVPFGASAVLAFGPDLSRRYAFRRLHDRIVPLSPGQRTETFEAAAASLALVPSYLEWCASALSVLVPLICTDAPLCSQTRAEWPRAVAVGCAFPPEVVGELIVHETSHQYFFAACQLGPVDDGSDRRQFFSPLKGQVRPLDKILLAYHALANICRYYELLLTAGPTNEAVCRQRLDSLAAKLAVLREPLEDTDALTAVGRSLYEPLALESHAGDR